MPKDDSLDSMINTIAEVCKPLVIRIQAKHPTTKDWYGDYMSAIPRIVEMCTKGTPVDHEMNQKIHIAIGVALQRAGANKNGVQSALRAMGHI